MKAPLVYPCNSVYRPSVCQTCLVVVAPVLLLMLHSLTQSPPLRKIIVKLCKLYTTRNLKKNYLHIRIIRLHILKTTRTMFKFSMHVGT